VDVDEKRDYKTWSCYFTKADEDWIECWENIPQEKPQKWIERIPIHIQEVIKLKGGNEYKESISGRKKNPNRVH
jgi:hypothetical protein